MLVTDQLVKTFGATRAVDGVSLEIPEGQMVGIIGRSGAGKSTLLRLINRLADPTSGSISVAGTEVTALKGKALHRWRSDCAMIFQQFNLVDRLDVITNVLVGRVNYQSTFRSMVKMYSADERAMAIRALDRLGMADTALQRAGTLSGGQQQRVAIARALVQQPNLILADEPVASLDPSNAQIVMDFLRQINKKDGLTVLCNLHHLSLAKDYCDRIIGMTDGKVCCDCTPAQLDVATIKAIYGSDAAAEHMDNDNMLKPNDLDQSTADENLPMSA